MLKLTKQSQSHSASGWPAWSAHGLFIFENGTGVVQLRVSPAWNARFKRAQLRLRQTQQTQQSLVWSSNLCPIPKGNLRCYFRLSTSSSQNQNIPHCSFSGRYGTPPTSTDVRDSSPPPSEAQKPKSNILGARWRCDTEPERVGLGRAVPSSHWGNSAQLQVWRKNKHRRRRRNQCLLGHINGPKCQSLKFLSRNVDARNFRATRLWTFIPTRCFTVWTRHVLFLHILLHPQPKISKHVRKWQYS